MRDRQIEHGEPVFSGYDDGWIYCIPLGGDLARFDVALLASGVTAIRKNDEGDQPLIVMEQAVPEFAVDFLRDIQLESVCTHIQCL